MTVEFRVPEGDEYFVALQPLLAPLYGIYEVSIDDQPLTEINGYAPSIRAGAYESLGTLPLASGAHRLTIEAIGKDPASTNYFISLMRLLLVNEEGLASFQATMLEAISATQTSLEEIVSRLAAGDASADAALRARAAELDVDLEALATRVNQASDIGAIHQEFPVLALEVARFGDQVDARVARPASPFGPVPADSMSLIYPEALPCGACLSGPAELSLAQGEYENVQAVVMAYGQDLTAVAARIAGVTGPDGGAVDGALEISVDPLGSVLVQNAPAPTPPVGSRPGNWEGWIPDPIRSWISSSPSTLGGRATSCERYSQTERCLTEIWATVVKFEEGRFVRRTGWAFNNLAYLRS